MDNLSEEMKSLLLEERTYQNTKEWMNGGAEKAEIYNQAIDQMRELNEGE